MSPHDIRYIFEKISPPGQERPGSRQIEGEAGWPVQGGHRGLHRPQGGGRGQGGRAAPQHHPPAPIHGIARLLLLGEDQSLVWCGHSGNHPTQVWNMWCQGRREEGVGREGPHPRVHSGGRGGVWDRVVITWLNNAQETYMREQRGIWVESSGYNCIWGLRETLGSVLDTTLRDPPSSKVCKTSFAVRGSGGAVRREEVREEKGGREHGGKSSEGREGATPRKCPCVMEVVVRGFFKSRVLPYNVFGLLFISKLQFSNRIIKT